jgi:hypothetical protein
VPIVTGTWATADDAADLTGRTPTDLQLNAAQIMIENRIRRVYRATDADRSEYRWLREAVAWQAGYLANPTNANLLDSAEISSTGQDGWSVTFREGSAPRRYAPEAIEALNCLPGSQNVTLRVNSAFQGAGRRRHGARWRKY